jgi:hypothetical protein
MMALIYIGIMLYFKTIGGYKTVRIDGEAPSSPEPPKPAP